MEQWIRSTFDVIYYDFDDYEAFVFYEDNGNIVEVHIPIFLSIFGACEVSYEDLYGHAEGIGSWWTRYFDMWKEQGILN